MACERLRKAFGYNQRPRRQHESCPLCKSRTYVQFADRDRYAFDVPARLCMQCGVVYLGEQLTESGYGEFYDKFYRPLVSAYWGLEVSAKTLQGEQERYGWRLARSLEPLLPHLLNLSILDVGGSAGRVCQAFVDLYRARNTRISRALVVDPSPDELNVAAEGGLETQCILVEQITSSTAYDIVLLCRTIDHLADPVVALQAIRECLSDEGFFFADISDWEYVARTEGIQESLHIDHPFNFTREVFVSFLRAMGFEPTHQALGPGKTGFGCLCRKAPPTLQIELPAERAVARRLWYSICEMRADQAIRAGLHPLRPSL